VWRGGGPEAAGRARAPAIQSEYFDLDEIEAMLEQLAMDHPDITNLFVIGTTFS
jgi:hypothetical protein